MPPSNLRRTVEAIIWRCQNGAKAGSPRRGRRGVPWRAVPAELGPWWMAAQTFIRWARLGVWERLLDWLRHAASSWDDVPRRDLDQGARPVAAGAAKKGDWERAVMHVRRLGDLVAGMAPRPS